MAEGETAFVFTSKKPGRAYKSMVATAVKVMKKLIERSKNNQRGRSSLSTVYCKGEKKSIEMRKEPVVYITAGSF